VTGLMSYGPGAALGRGLAVFPIPPGQRKASPAWQLRASTDPGQPWPAGSNVGVGCRASGVVVLDLDRKNSVDGVATLERLCAAHEQPWPQTFTVATANGGLHLYFTAPPARVVVSSIGILGPGIDVRAPGRMSGGYVLGPGSVVGNRAYAVVKDLPIAPAPHWLALLLCPVRPPLRLGAKTGDIRMAVARRGRAAGTSSGTDHRKEHDQ
jgi:hypothetical protein